jgi:hypothetical protein
VRGPGRHGDDVAGLGDDRLEALAEAHAPGDDLEALLLGGVDVEPGDAPLGRQLHVEGEQLAARVGGGAAERDALAAGGVLDDLSGVGHDGAP